jgi:hypothetical protein
LSAANSAPDDKTRKTISMGVAYSWRLFNVNFGTAPKFIDAAPNFMKRPPAEQETFVDRLYQLSQLMAEKDDEGSLGVALTRCYLVGLQALAGKSPDVTVAMINRMADQLDPFNREGFALLPSAAKSGA